VTAKLVVLDTPNLRDVPAGLRRLADDLEHGRAMAVEAIIITRDADDHMRYYSYGNIVDVAHGIGMLHIAAVALASGNLEDD